MWNKLKQAIANKRFEWRLHTLVRLTERNILQDDVLKVIIDGEMIEEYPQDTPHPSALFYELIDERPLHAVCSYDEKNDWAYMITAYEPDDEHFEKDFKTRKRK